MTRTKHNEASQGTLATHEGLGLAYGGGLGPCLGPLQAPLI